MNIMNEYYKDVYYTDEHLDELKSLIKKIGHSNPQFVWKNVKTMDELFYCNKEFIKNNLSESFYHYGKLALDSQPLIKYLLELHDKKVFTLNGQGPLMNYDKWINKKWINYEGLKCGKWFYSIEQKPYLICIIKKKYVNNLLEFLKKINESVSDDKINYMIIGENFKFTNINEKKYNVTRSKTYKKMSDKNTSEWEYGTNIWDHYSFSEHICYFLDYPKLYDKIVKKYVSLNLCTQNYGSHIVLEKVLLEFFNNK